MKILRLTAFLFVSCLLLCYAPVRAQNPAVTVQAGYPVGRPASQVVYANSKYVLLTTYMYNQVFQSATGTAWSTVSTTGLATTQLNFIAYGAGLFVVVGDGGVIQTSTDGIAWTSRTSGTTNNLYRIYYLNSKFFAIGKSRTLLTSVDGISWTTVSFSVGAATDDFNSLSYGNGLYVLSARSSLLGGSGSIVYRSLTAANNSWTYATNTPAYELVNRIQFLNDKFWAFFAGNRMFTSPDAVSWTEITNAVTLKQPDNSTISWNSYHQIFNGVWDGTKYNFYGCSQYYSGYGSTFTSTDGINFTLLTKTAYIVPQESTILNGTYFICGNEGIVSSSDGLTYKHSGAGYYDMVKTANKYVAVGAVSSDGGMYNSTDFTTWTSRGPGNIRELYSAAYDGSQVLAGGYTGVYSSSNEGDSWTKVYSNVNETFSSLAYGNSRFVASGYDGNSGFLRYSIDGGVNWTNASTLNNYYNKVRYVNNRFFALGTSGDDYTGRIFYSTDGSSWTDVTPALGFNVYYYNDVVFDGTKYHILGMDENDNFFTVSTSTPQTAASYGNKAVCINTPTGVTLGGNWDQGLLVYSGGRFTGAVIDVNSGQDYIITSANGSSWTALPQNSYSTATAAYANGSTVQMLGRANAQFTVSNVSTLPVRLLNFDGSLYEGAVQLRWSTVTEQNTKQFTVQHSTDGILWKGIGTVKAAGNSNTKQDYQLAHTNPVEGANFYRLLQQDNDGNTTYSHVIMVQYGKALAATWFPNPVKTKLSIRTPTAQAGTITIFTAAGQPVKRAAISGYETGVDMSSLPAGIYVAEIQQGAQRQRLSVIKN